MVPIQAFWEGFAGLATGVSLLALGADLVSIVMLSRLIRDRRALLAAERLEQVELSPLMLRHLPAARQTNILSEELPLAKEIVETKTHWWRKLAIVSSLLLVTACLMSSLLIHRNATRLAAANAEVQIPQLVDPLMSVAGIWGWKYDTLLSCGENPLTITLSENRTKLFASFAKPVRDGKEERTAFNYDIVGVGRNSLMLSLSDADTPIDQSRQPRRWYIDFLNANTITFRRSDLPVTRTGEIGRCHSWAAP